MPSLKIANIPLSYCSVLVVLTAGSFPLWHPSIERLEFSLLLAFFHIYHDTVAVADLVLQW